LDEAERFMSSVTFKCPAWLFGLIAAGAAASLGILPLVRAAGWPQVIVGVLGGGAVFVFGYALTLLPTRLVISDEGVWQKLCFSESRLRWEDMVEWRHCEGGAEFESGEMRARTNGRLHSTEFWVKDKAGRQHRFKRWLVFGERSARLAEILRGRGIEGG
jgi:hypothetical protein